MLRRGVSTTLTPCDVLCAPALSLPKKKPRYTGRWDGDVLIESGQIGFEQMGNIADRVTDFSRDGIIRVDRERH